MPSITKECRQDDNSPSDMPDTIHLGTHFHVAAGINAFIIEDTTGYEVIKGSYNVFIGREIQTQDSLIYGEQVVPESVQRDSSPKIVSRRSDTENEVTRAFSLLISSSSLSDITFAEESAKQAKQKKENHFECERIAL